MTKFPFFPLCCIILRAILSQFMEIKIQKNKVKVQTIFKIMFLASFFLGEFFWFGLRTIPIAQAACGYSPVTLISAQSSVTATGSLNLTPTISITSGQSTTCAQQVSFVLSLETSQSPNGQNLYNQTAGFSGNNGTSASTVFNISVANFLQSYGSNLLNSGQFDLW